MNFLEQSSPRGCHADRHAYSFWPVAATRSRYLKPREVPASFGVTRGLSIAFADVMPGDSTNEYITGTGPGRESLVRIWNSKGIERRDSIPSPVYRGGVYVATGDVDNDGNIELICSTARHCRAGEGLCVPRRRSTIAGIIRALRPALQRWSSDHATGDVTGDRAREHHCRPRDGRVDQ